MRFLPDFLNVKAAQVMPPLAANPVRSLFITTFNMLRNVVPQYNNVVAARRAKYHPVLYRCLNKIGLTVSSVTWYVTEDPDGEKADIDKNARLRKALTKTLKRPNQNMTGSQLRYWFAVSWANYGEASFKVAIDSNGAIIGIWPLAKEWLEIKLDAYGNDQQFEYGKGGAPKDIIRSFTHCTKDASGYPAETFAFRIRKVQLDGSYDPESNNTPLQAAGKPAEMYDRLMDRGLDTADAQPNTRWLVTADPETTEPQAEAIKEKVDEMRPGGDSSGTVLFVAGRDVKVTELKNDLSDIHTKIPMDDMTRMICGLFNIPIALIGLNSADGSKFASNYAESRLTFFEDTIDPDYLVPLEEGFTIALCRAGYIVKFDRDSIPAIKKQRAEIAKLYDGVTFLTETEKREVTGWPAKKENGNGNDGASNTNAN